MKKWKILIIDDDIDFVEATKIVLETKYYVSVAYNGEEGRRKLKMEKPDLIILDMMMDGRGEGFLFSREIEKSPEYSNIPILMLTGMRKQTGFFPIEDDPRDSKYLPVDEFVEKPIEPQDLLKKVEQLLSKKGIKNGIAKDL